MARNDTLNPRQTAAAAALATGATRAEAAEASGVSLSTVARWSRSEPFRAAIRAAQAEVVDQARRRLAGELEASVDAAVAIRDGASSDSVRLAAARSLWEFYRTAAVAELEARVAELEAKRV